MRLSDLLASCPSVVLASQGDPQTEILSLTEDSRTVAPGALFVARAGRRSDGRAFIADAVGRGAAAVLLEAQQGPPHGPGTPAALDLGALPAGARRQPALLTPRGTSLELASARLAESFHGRPSHALQLVGVTGTNGKTTTTFLIQQMLRAAGERCGLIGTVVTDDGSAARPSELTTPSAIEISATLARMVANGCQAAAMECSSHALHQGRTAGLRFAVAVFTNLTGDHLDYHGTMEAYADAKAILFRELEPSAVAVVNGDVAWTSRVLEGCRATILRCSLRDPGADFFAHLESLDPGCTVAAVSAPWGRFRLRLPLVGLHNLMNALEAAASVHALGVPGAVIERALSTCAAPPGRLEPVVVPGAPCTVLVDYAHTDDALENVLRAIRSLVPAGARLHVVFGCGGDRDRTKRPRMAAVAARLGDEVVVTSDNPRTEDPAAIVAEILAGVPAGTRSRVRAIVDRAAAIEEAIEDARPGDVVVIAGKGHEDYQIVGTVKRPFDDRLVARAALSRRLGGTPVGCGG